MTIEEAVLVLAKAIKSVAGGEHHPELDRIIDEFASAEPEEEPAEQ